MKILKIKLRCILKIVTFIIFGYFILKAIYGIEKQNDSAYKFIPQTVANSNSSSKLAGRSSYHLIINKTEEASTIKVAIGMGITSQNTKPLNERTIKKNLVFFNELLPTFCSTASKGYIYNFYLAHDKNDSFFSSRTSYQLMQQTFRSITYNCDLEMTLTMVQCTHDHSPGWAQNDAMMEAYLDNCDYYYRVNDDTVLVTPNWTIIFMDRLQSYKPPNIGVVGPTSDAMGFLTYDFVHRTHIDIMGFYYPRVFFDWWADYWISWVYMPKRVLKIKEVTIKHTGTLGRRYVPNIHTNHKLIEERKRGVAVLTRYIAALNSGNFKQSHFQHKRVISMALTSTSINHTYGAIRNAQLMPVYFPGWIMYAYVSSAYGTTITEQKILMKLHDLGAVIKYVSDEVESKVSPQLWSYLVADEPDVDLFIFRSVLGRISDRDFAAVNEWIRSGSAFHCIRDHPNHFKSLLMSELWGAKSRQLKNVIGTAMENFLLEKITNLECKSNSTEECEDFINASLWTQIKDIICFEMENCGRNGTVYSLRSLKKKESFIGQKFDSYGYPEEEGSNMYSKNCTFI